MEALIETFFILIYAITILVLCFFGGHRAFMIYLYVRHRKNVPVIPPGGHDYKPFVTVQLPMFNEKLVAERIIRAAAAMEYPRDKFEIQILDDSTDETIAIIQRLVREVTAMGIEIHYVHRTDRTGYKAGALEHGMKTAKGELIAIFDADFIPKSDFLENTVPYFVEKHIGVVQTRWEHLNPDFNNLTRVQAMMLDGHFVLESAARSRSGRFFNFNGTAGVWRREAITESGGWQHDTLTEDLDLSYRAQMRGWKFIFIQDVTVPSELPIEINAFKTQQFRWSKGAVQAGVKLLPSVWKAKLPLKVKIEALCHMGGHISYPLLLLLCLMLPFTVWYWRDDPFRGLDLSIYHIFVLGTLSVVMFYSIAANEAGRGFLRTVLNLVPMMSLGAGLTVSNTRAFIEAINGKPSEFTRTPKYCSDGKTAKEAYSTPRDSFTWVEFAMGLHLTCGIFLAFFYEQYTAIPFMMIFQFGFLYVAFLSLATESEARKPATATAQTT